MLKTVKQCLTSAFPDAVIEIQDFVGDGQHLKVCIKSSKFEGKNLLEQQRMVYAVIEPLWNGTLHALSIKTEALRA